MIYISLYNYIANDRPASNPAPNLAPIDTAGAAISNIAKVAAAVIPIIIISLRFVSALFFGI